MQSIVTARLINSIKISCMSAVSSTGNDSENNLYLKLQRNPNYLVASALMHLVDLKRWALGRDTSEKAGEGAED